MRILFLGGTGFVGRHMVAAALNRKHQVTLFNRGKTADAGLFPNASRILGNRDGGLAALDDQRWDAVVDVNGYLPRLVRDSTQRLQSRTARYLYVSTGSVYDLKSIHGNVGEDAPLVQAEDPESQVYWGKEYGALKLLCEEVVEEAFPGQSTVLRLGVVAGPYDPTDRVTYWAARIAQGGEVLIPASPEQKIRFIDARDLAEFAILALEKNLNGIYNTLGNVLTWKEWTQACQTAGGGDAKLTWVGDEKFIQESMPASTRPFGALPMMPSFLRSLSLINSDKALAAGLRYRPAVETARDVLTWHRTRRLVESEDTVAPEKSIRDAFDWGPPSQEAHWVAGLTRKQEATLLQKWHSQ